MEIQVWKQVLARAPLPYSPLVDFHHLHFSTPLARSAAAQTELPGWDKNAMSTELSVTGTPPHTTASTFTFFSKRAKPASAAADSFRSSSLVLSGWKLFLKFSFCLFKLFAQRSMSLAIWNAEWFAHTAPLKAINLLWHPFNLTCSFSEQVNPLPFIFKPQNTGCSAGVSLYTVFKDNTACCFYCTNPSYQANPLCDGSVILPLILAGFHKHSYAELISALKPCQLHLSSAPHSACKLKACTPHWIT